MLLTIHLCSLANKTRTTAYNTDTQQKTVQTVIYTVNKVQCTVHRDMCTVSIVGVHQAGNVGSPQLILGAGLTWIDKYFVCI